MLSKMIIRVVLTAFCLGIVVRSQLNADFPEYTCSTLISDVRECQAGSKALPHSVFPLGVSVNIKDPSKFFVPKVLYKSCKAEYRSKFRAAAICIINAYRRCGDDNFKRLVLTATQFANAFDEVCDDIFSYTNILKCISSSYLDCVRNKLAQQYQYNRRPRLGRPFGEYIDFYCGRIRIEDQCVLTDIDVQECFPTGSNEKFKRLRTMIRPEACGL